jgi:hypothetical protein
MIIRQPEEHLATSPYLPQVASSAVSVGDLAIVPLGSPWLVVALQETPVPKEAT